MAQFLRPIMYNASAILQAVIPDPQEATRPDFSLSFAESNRLRSVFFDFINFVLGSYSCRKGRFMLCGIWPLASPTRGAGSTPLKRPSLLASMICSFPVSRLRCMSSIVRNKFLLNLAVNLEFFDKGTS